MNYARTYACVFLYLYKKNSKKIKITIACMRTFMYDIASRQILGTYRVSEKYSKKVKKVVDSKKS